MSKNRNRAKFNKAKTNSEYNRIMKGDEVYCRICVRRAGRYDATCYPIWGNRDKRENRNWKNQRKTQWKS